MACCQVCGKDYEQSLEVHTGGQQHTFDSVECAIHRLATLAGVAGVRDHA